MTPVRLYLAIGEAVVMLHPPLAVQQAFSIGTERGVSKMTVSPAARTGAPGVDLESVLVRHQAVRRAICAEGVG